MTFQEAMTMIGTFGVPLTLLVMFLYWFRPKADKLIDSHTHFVSVVETEVKSQTSAVNEIKIAMAEMRGDIKHGTEAAQHTADFIKEHSHKVLENHQRIIETQQSMAKVEERVVDLINNQNKEKP